MSTTVEPDSEGTPVAEGEIVLTPKLSDRWILGPQHVLVVAIWSILFLLFNYLPLQSPRLWGDLIYGEWILAHRTLPTEDPVMPLAEGMPVIHSTWLTQVTLAAVASLHDDWLSVLFAVIMLLTFGLLARVYFVRGGNAGVALGTTLLVFGLAWTHHTTLRPEHLAGFCFAVLLWLIASSCRDTSFAATTEGPAVPSHRWRRLLGVPILFVAWANLDGSFVWGLIVLGCLLAGEVVDAARRTRSLGGVVGDPRVRHQLYLCELALLAVLLNPAGIDLLLNLLWFGQRENLADQLSWQQLLPFDRDGWGFAVSILLMVVAFRRSQAPIPFAAGLMLLVFAAGALFQRRWIYWYAPVYGWTMAPHLASLWSQVQGRFAAPVDGTTAAAVASGQTESASPGGGSWVYSLFCVLVVWIAFSLSGLSRPVLGGKPRPPAKLYGPKAPLELIDALRDRPPQGQVFHPLWWGDSLVRGGPDDFLPFVTSHLQVVPRRVWLDYQRVLAGEAGWRRIFTRYRVTTVIADKDQQRAFIRMIRTDPEWELRYEDELAILFAKRPPVTRPRDSSEEPGSTPPSQQPEEPQEVAEQ
jgi:hypothetical protein